jgi:hypothetical protein
VVVPASVPGNNYQPYGTGSAAGFGNEQTPPTGTTTDYGSGSSANSGNSSASNVAYGSGSGNASSPGSGADYLSQMMDAIWSSPDSWMAA